MSNLFDWDSTVDLEQVHLKEGFDEGHEDGLVAGEEEARQVGLKLGFEVGEELGFYRGCAAIWASVIRVEPARFSTRVQKGIGQLAELLDKYPVMEPEDERVQEIMDALRLKFRALCASMGIKLDYNGYPNSSSSSNAGDFGF